MSETNKHIEYVHFKMQTFNEARQMLDKNDFMRKIDLSTAYDCVPVHKDHIQYLQFQYKGEIYQYRGFPNGLCEAPRIFTKLTKPIMAFGHKFGIKLIMYLDDILVANQNKNLLNEQVSLLVRLLMLLGFLINTSKTSHEASQEVVFLGFHMDTKAMTFKIKEDQVQKITKSCINLKTGLHSARTVQGLVGSINFARTVIMRGALHYRSLQEQVSKATKNGNWENPIRLNKASQTEVDWWLEHIKIENLRAIRDPIITIIITTDASKEGWGGTYKNLNTQRRLKTQGPWSEEQRKLHINVLELQAVQNSLESLANKAENTSIKVMLDNTSAVAAIKKMGSSKSWRLNKIATEIWNWCRSKGIMLIAKHLPGSMNKEADQLSRNVQDSSDWELNQMVFQELNRQKGPFTVDLFAKHWNMKVKFFYSMIPQPKAAGIDALTYRWPKTGGYAFPPICLIPAVLNQIKTQKIKRITVITPVWTTQTWYPKLLEMTSGKPILLPYKEDLLKNPKGENHPLGNYTRFRLAAWTVSGDTTEIRDFQTKLPYLWQVSIDQQQLSPTIAPGHAGLAGVIENKLIRFHHLYHRLQIF